MRKVENYQQIMPYPGIRKQYSLISVVSCSPEVVGVVSDRLSLSALTAAGRAIAAITANETVNDLTIADFIWVILSL